MAARRSQSIALAVAIITLYFLFFFNNDDSIRRNTESALSRRRGVLRGDLSDADLTAQTNAQLQAILDKLEGKNELFDGSGLKDMEGGDSTTSEYGGKKEKAVVESTKGEEEVPVAGRTSMPAVKGHSGHDSKPPAEAEESDNGEEVAYNGNKVEKAKDDGEDMARQELQAILKKSPIIIFSKSYCPYSKRAKRLLLETYTIVPTPYVVELDLLTTPLPHSNLPNGDEDEPAPTLGRKLQDLLFTLTGRKTVPNVMINAHSLGGSDDIAAMDKDGTLKEQILKLGRKRITSIERKEEDD